IEDMVKDIPRVENPPNGRLSRGFGGRSANHLKSRDSFPFFAGRPLPAAFGGRPMNYLRTAILLAGLTALFMGVGFLIGGEGGALIALAVAAAMNVFAYWNSDKAVLSMHGAREVDDRS